MPARLDYKRAIHVDGAKLTEARIAANLTLEEVAAALGCNRSSVSRWERGLVNPPEEHIFKMITLYKRGDFVVEGDKE